MPIIFRCPCGFTSGLEAMESIVIRDKIKKRLFITIEKRIRKDLKSSFTNIREKAVTKRRKNFISIELRALVYESFDRDYGGPDTDFVYVHLILTCPTCGTQEVVNCY